MENIDIVKIWNKVLEILKQKIPASTFDAWILPMVPQGYDDEQFTVLTGHLLAKQVIMQQYYSTVVDAFSEVLHKNINFNMVVDKDLLKKVEKQQQKLLAEVEKKEKVTDNSTEDDKYDSLKQMQSFANLNLKFKFDNFVVGSNNKFAYAAAMAVAKNPGKQYNPLFIYGNSGLGKTHLIQSIGHYILYNHNDLRVKYLKAEEFLNDLLNCLMNGGDKNKNMAKFRQKYRNIDVLLIDDIQFIEGKERMKEELFNTFETLYMKGKQIVFTSDRQPKDINELPERLRTRFEWGLLADVQPPDFETRIAILSTMAKNNIIKLPFDVLEFLAQVYKQNVRELEGAFNKVTAYASIYESDLTLDIVKKAINYKDNKQQINLDYILNKTASFFSLKPADLKSTSRSQNIAYARQLAIYLCKELTTESLVSIGQFFDKKHSTILYSYEKVKKEMQLNYKIAQDIDELKTLFN